MTVPLRRLVVAGAIAGLCGGLGALPNRVAGAAQRPGAKKPARPAPPRKPAVKPAVPGRGARGKRASRRRRFEGGRPIGAAPPRLIGDSARSRDDDYLVIRLHVETPPGKTADVPIRAAFALLSPGTPPVKYPVFSMGYFQPISARPASGTEAVRISGGGANFSIAAEVPKSEKQFRLVVQKPVAEVTIGRRRRFLRPRAWMRSAAACGKVRSRGSTPIPWCTA